MDLLALESGCRSAKDDLLISSAGSLCACHEQCTRNLSCAAVAYHRETGVCALKRRTCLRELRFGDCRDDRRWCSYALRRRLSRLAAAKLARALAETPTGPLVDVDDARVAQWATVLRGGWQSGKYWVGGVVPTLQPPHHVAKRRWRARCPGGTLVQAGTLASAPWCSAWWHCEYATECALLSVGVGNEWGFEDNLTRRGCTVHAYDPTTRLRARHEAHAAARSRVRFFFAGMRGAASATASALDGRALASAPSRVAFDTRPGRNYGSIDTSTLLTLDEMLTRLPVPPTIVKLDCEGCEWGALAGDAPRLLDGVRLLFLELHVSPTMVHGEARGLTRLSFLNLFEQLLGRGWRLLYLRNNRGFPSDQHVVDFLQPHLPHDQCCYELALVNLRTILAPGELQRQDAACLNVSGVSYFRRSAAAGRKRWTKRSADSR